MTERAASLFVLVETGYEVTKRDALRKLAAVSWGYNKDTKRYEYLFRPKDLDAVKAVLGSPLDLNEEDLELVRKSVSKAALTIKTEPYKGKGFVHVTSLPEEYAVKTVINKRERTFHIPRQSVDALWGVIKNYPLNKQIKTRTIAEHWCHNLGIIRFNRHTGKFSFEHFFGDRPSYFQLYYSLKVLGHYGAIIHHRNGKVERKAETWAHQTVLKQ